MNCASCIEANRDHTSHDQCDMTYCQSCGELACPGCMADHSPIQLPIVNRIEKQVCYSCRERIKENQNVVAMALVFRDSLKQVINACRKATSMEANIETIDKFLDSLGKAVSCSEGIAIGALRTFGYPVPDAPEQFKGVE